MTRLVIVTDLDGTLLGKEDYSFADAQDAVDRAKILGIPIIFCSSKTLLEQRYYQERLGVSAPMILENGSAISWTAAAGPGAAGGAATTVLGLPADQIRAEFFSARRELRLKLRCFAELPASEVAARTGLDLAAAERAKCREYSETVIGEVATLETAQLTALLRCRGISVTRGTRFLTLTARQADKGRATSLALSMMHKELGPVYSVGLGDAENDLPMLEAVDRGYYLREGEAAAIALGERIVEVRGGGPKHWRRLVTRLLDEFS